MGSRVRIVRRSGLLEMGVQEGGGGVSPPELEAGAGGDAEEGILGGGVRGVSNKDEPWVVDGVDGEIGGAPPIAEAGPEGERICGLPTHVGVEGEELEVIGAFCYEVTVIEVGVGVGEGEAKTSDERDIRIGNDVQTEEIGRGAVEVKGIVLVVEAGELKTAGEEGIERYGGRCVLLLILGREGEGDGEALVREECLVPGEGVVLQGLMVMEEGLG